MANIIKKPFLFGVIAVIIVGSAGAYFYFGGEGESPYEFIVAERGDIIQEVSVTGKVKPAKSFDLAFEKSGRVSGVYSDVSDKVRRGQILAQLDSAELSAQLNEAEANLKAQEAKLEEFRRGSRPEEIKIQEVKVENAKIALEDAKKNLVDSLQDSYTKSDDAIRNKIDQFLSNPRGSSPQVDVAVANSELKASFENDRVAMESLLVSWKFSLGQTTVLSDLIRERELAEQNLVKVKTFLEKAALIVNGLTASSALSQTTIDGYKTDVSTGRTNVNTAITNLSTSEEKLRAAQSSLALAENQLVLEMAGTAPEKVMAQEAAVEQAMANIQNYQAQIAKTIMRSPVDGMVTKQDAKQGEIISANSVLASIISDAQFEIETNVPEADIAKVKIGDTAKVTLDAHGDDIIFEAVVVSVDPAETIVEGVATYKTILQFAKKDDMVKSGMTANIDILTAKKENVIAIPQRAIGQKNGDRIVRVIKDGDIIEEVKVKTGLRGSDGNIEIIEGVNEGDKVVVFVKE